LPIPERLNVLLIGSGGREHAMAASLARSPRLATLFCAPGNPGMAALGQCLALDPIDFAGILAACRRHEIGLVAIGPEAPLCAGLVDALTEAGIPAFGPTKDAAQLEGSKAFTKDLCARHGIPTAAYRRFDAAAPALVYLTTVSLPVVVKADGLAAGKGVTIAETLPEARQAVEEAFGGRFGAAGASIVIEEFLVGEEASVFAIVDGETVLPFGTAQDHKRVFDGDRGPNTGGMGAYSPAPVMTNRLTEEAFATIIRPTARAMAAEGRPFRGVLYAGLMLTAKGPQLIEYNCRLGDPEAQVILPRLETDFLEILLATCHGTLEQVRLSWRNETALTVVLASKGYPEHPESGAVIPAFEALPGTAVFHAGTKWDGQRLVAAGGRVLNVTALADTVAAAQQQAYALVERIAWPGCVFRRDIGWRALASGRKSRSP
jgi:phosphoribosylamine--glycine ligase